MHPVKIVVVEESGRLVRRRRASRRLTRVSGLHEGTQLRSILSLVQWGTLNRGGWGKRCQETM